VSTAVAACATIGLLSNFLFVRSFDRHLTILIYVALFVKICRSIDRLITATRRPRLRGDGIGEQRSPSTAGERVLDAGAVDVDDEPTAELDPALVHRPIRRPWVDVFRPLPPAGIRKGRGKASEGFA
jgi:hypothetical protein